MGTEPISELYLCTRSNLIRDKNAFQWDAYRPLVDRLLAGCLLWGVCLLGGGVCAGGGVCHTPSHPDQRQTPPSGQTDTCENLTFADFVCGR